MGSKITRLLSVFFCMALVFTSTFTVHAKTQASLEDERSKIEAEIESAEKRLANLKSQKQENLEYLTAIQAKIDLLQDKIDNLESQRNVLQNQIDELDEKIAQTEAEIEETQKKIEQKKEEFKAVYEVYCQRLRAIYISGNASTLEMLLDTGLDVGAMLTRAEMIKQVSSQDKETLDELMVMMEEIEQERQVLALKKIELNEDKEELDAQKAELQSAIDEIASSKSELDAEAAEANRLISSLNSSITGIMETIETDRELVERIEREIRELANQDNSTESYEAGSGVLGYPTSYRSISAYFPRYSSGAYHSGIDFSCPTGTPVYAADSGYVTSVKYLNYSYGYHVIINHGNGLMTLYAHNSSIVVSSGQAVKKGQLIAYSGSTGNSTGPHCHFEVRLNGTAVNPLNYLS